MACIKHFHFFFVVVLPIFLLSLPVHSDDEEDHLLQGLNSFRLTGNLPAFSKNKNANCVAKEIVDNFDDQPCTNPSNSQGNQTSLTNYPKAISKCDINPATATDVMVLPVCVPRMVPTLVLTNYTRTHFSNYINDSSYSGIGLSSEDDWIVVVLTSNTQAGSLANGASSLVNAKIGLGCNLLGMSLLGLVLTS